MILLMVLLSTPADSAPHQRPEFGPMTMQTMEHCLRRRSSMQTYLENEIRDRRVRFRVFCVEFRAIGYDEAVDAFNRSLGRDM